MLNGFLAKSDGKDKLTALVQYACMFLSAGEPGNIKKIQTSVTAARKVFRIMRPLESLSPVLLQPGFTGKQPLAIESINKLKNVLMALYFAADHVVWAYQIGLTTDKKLGERVQKISLWSWAMGSVCTIVGEAHAIAQLSSKPRHDETPEQWSARQQEARTAINQRLLVLVHAVVQAALAAGLLQLLPWKPRTVGFLGVVASAMNCWLLLPSLPKKPVSQKASSVVPSAGQKLVLKSS